MDFSNETMDEIFNIFQIESEELINKINTSLLKLGKNPNDKNTILELFRDAHSLKGASRMVGFNDVQAVAHKIEDILDLAKENKLTLDKEIIKSLDKAIDFLADVIEKSTEKRKQVYDANYPKQMATLMKIIESVNAPQIKETPSKKNTTVITTKSFKNNLEKINKTIINSLLILMQLEEESTPNLISQLIKNITLLEQLFAKTEENEIKELLATISVKLNITQKGSNAISFEEACEIHTTIDKIIENFTNFCELQKLEIVDYYSALFEINDKVEKIETINENMDSLEDSAEEELCNDIQEFSKQELQDFQELSSANNQAEIEKELAKIETLNESNVIEYQEEVKESEKVEKIEKESTNNSNILDSIKFSQITPEKEVFNIITIKDTFEKFLNFSCSLDDFNKTIIEYKNKYKNEKINTILDKIKSVLDYATSIGTKLNNDAITSINESLDYCANLETNTQNNNTENDDSSLIVQRLEIIQQLIEFDQQKTETEAQLTVNPNQEKIKKLTNIDEMFNTGEIKTLRVESSKLDKLINQINELTIEKIKTKKHLLELNDIYKDFEDYQREVSKISGYLKYLDRKNQNPTFIDFQQQNSFKSLINFFTDNNKNLQKLKLKINNLHRTIQEDDTKLNITVDNLSNMVKNIRILPFATIFHMFGKMIKDIAEESNKKIDFEVQGSETSADKKIIEEIKTPLIHIIRNSIDHGIETPEERLALNKPETGKIILSAKQSNNKVIIKIIDDGRGININKIKEKAISKGFLTPEELSHMTDNQILELIFTPGFSTGEVITNISGRGIGLDVVQSKISELNGKVKVLSELNKGCCVQIELPTTMAIMKVFIVKTGSELYAIPIDTVHSVLRKSTSEIIYHKKHNTIIFENETIKLVNLASVLNIKEDEKRKDKQTILIIENDGKRIALSVDKLLGEQEVMHKKLAAPFYKLKKIMGITTLISGKVCLILNMTDIINSINEINNSTFSTTTNEIDNKHYTILLVDDSATTSTLEKNILKKVGYNVEIAENPILAFKKLEKQLFDMIITDFEMPEMNGVDFVKKLKTNEMYSEIPVIMVSSIFNEEKRKQATQAGAIKYILKSTFDQDDFKNTISNILKQTKFEQF
ncbi:MAG: hybrid sensor histidine kinase/response regulator [bacterium]|nr:hybrid sensor histidine kinase/response regulator [bacterium]